MPSVPVWALVLVVATFLGTIGGLLGGAAVGVGIAVLVLLVATSYAYVGDKVIGGSAANKRRGKRTSG